MRTLTIALITATTLIALSLNTFAGEDRLIETLRPSARQAIGEFEKIDSERIEQLKKATAFIRKRMDEGKPAELTFVCTHNSRRSHLSQLWAQTAAIYYGLTNVTTYSGGTEATACNIRTIRALRRAGFSIAASTQSTNPVYLAQVSETQPPVKMFSKVYNDASNPQRDFAAVFSCDNAQEKCPVVQGAAVQIPVLFVDPKVSDNTPREAATYDERSRQIAREMFYMMSAVSAGNTSRASL